jgi:hypothetical protein
MVVLGMFSPRIPLSKISRTACRIRYQAEGIQITGHTEGKHQDHHTAGSLMRISKQHLNRKIN